MLLQKACFLASQCSTMNQKLQSISISSHFLEKNLSKKVMSVFSLLLKETESGSQQQQQQLPQQESQ